MLSLRCLRGGRRSRIEGIGGRGRLNGWAVVVAVVVVGGGGCAAVLAALPAVGARADDKGSVVAVGVCRDDAINDDGNGDDDDDDDDDAPDADSPCANPCDAVDDIKQLSGTCTNPMPFPSIPAPRIANL